MANMQGNRKHLPSPSITLPLIKGLSNRCTAVSKRNDSPAKQLRKEYEAYCTIACWAKLSLRRVQKKKQAATSDSATTDTQEGSNEQQVMENTSPNRYQCDIPIIERRHWMWRAFQSTDLRVRRIAFQMLLEQWYPATPSTAEEEEGAVILNHLLKELVDDVMYGMSYDNYIYDAQGVESGDPMVQYLGVLLYSITHTHTHPHTHTQSTHSNSKQGGSSGNAIGICPKRITGFVAGGGLRWAAGSLVELTSRLLLLRQAEG